MNTAFIANLILATVRMAIPLLLISLGELYGQRAGMVNIGLEGLAAIGSLVGFLVSFVTGSNWLGLLCGALAGVAVNMIYAFATVTLCADHTVYGMAINIFARAVVREKGFPFPVTITKSGSEKRSARAQLALLDLQKASAESGKEWSDEQIDQLIGEYRKGKK